MKYLTLTGDPDWDKWIESVNNELNLYNTKDTDNE